MNYNNVKVTTTSNFEASDVIEYLGPITAHVVVGMNLFKDLFAGLSDLFGGKSKTYQNSLEQVNNEVIQKLKLKAHKMGGNCILGLKIDNDEISAQGKSMLMVTALGTVARVNFKNQSSLYQEKRNVIEVDSDTFSYHEKKKKILDNCKNNTLALDDDFWEFINRHQVPEIHDYILEKYLSEVALDYQFEEGKRKKFYNNLTTYLSSIHSPKTKLWLYNNLRNQQPELVRNSIIKLIYKLRLLDYREVNTLLQESDFLIQKSGLQILMFNKLNYQKSDVVLIQELINTISSGFSKRGELSEKRNLMSSQKTKKWVCECGKSNNLDDTYCIKCNNDIYGFEKSEFKPNQVLDKLKNDLDVLNTIFIS